MECPSFRSGLEYIFLGQAGYIPYVSGTMMRSRMDGCHSDWRCNLNS